MMKGDSKAGAGKPRVHKLKAAKAKTVGPKAAKGKAAGPKAAKPKAGKIESAKPAGKRDENIALLKELQGLLSDIDEAGLRFLIDQARILRYNAEIDRINQELEVKQTKLRAELSAGKPPPKAVPRTSPGVTIEEGADRSHFIITLGSSRKFFVRDEFRGLVKICEAAENAAVGAERLFVWMKRNRSDVLADVGIGGGRNPILGELYRTISRGYRAKK